MPTLTARAGALRTFTDPGLAALPPLQGQGFGARLAARTVLITGAAQPMALAVADRIANEGARVFLVDEDAHALAQVLDALAQEGHGPDAVGGRSADVRDPEAWPALLDEAQRRFGALDALVNCTSESGAPGEEADGSGLQPSGLMDPMLDGRVAPLHLACVVALPALSRRGGSIVNVAAAAGDLPTHQAQAGRWAHGPESGVGALTRALAVDFGRQGVRVNAVCPEPPAKLGAESMASADEVAQAVAFLVSDDAAMVLGVNWPVGDAMAPALALG